MRHIPLVPSFLFFICVTLTFDDESISFQRDLRTRARARTHTHTYIYIYIYILCSWIDKSLMPKAFTSCHYWYLSIINSFRPTHLKTTFLPWNNILQSILMIITFIHLWSSLISSNMGPPLTSHLCLPIIIWKLLKLHQQFVKIL